MDRTASADDLYLGNDTLNSIAAHGVSAPLPWATDEEKLYTFAIARSDLEMTPGKLSSQVAHACSMSLLSFIRQNPEWTERFLELGTSGSRIALKAKNLYQMDRAYEEAQEKGLPCFRFVDSGHVMPPHFTGAPIATCVAIGPCTREDARAITKRYQLLA